MRALYIFNREFDWRFEKLEFGAARHFTPYSKRSKNRSISRREPDDLANDIFGNRQRTSSKSGILKAEAVLRFATILKSHGVEKFGDTIDSKRNAQIEKAIRKIPGQGSGISFEYFLMLAGSGQFVKADRMICRYVGEALGMKDPTTPAEARSLLVAAAFRLKLDHADLTPRALDYEVWNYERARTTPK